MIGLKKMTKKNKAEMISQYLDELFPEPKCELLYHTDYELLIAIVLSAQSTDKRVNMVTPFLFKKYPTLNDLATAPIIELEALLKPIGSYHKKAQYVQQIASLLVSNYQGKVPTNRKLLEQFPGVGRKTVNVFFSEFYQFPAFAVDTHVERLSKRLQLAKKDDTVVEVETKLKRVFPKERWARTHLQLVLFGRYYCKAIKPACETCKLKEICTYYHNK